MPNNRIIEQHIQTMEEALAHLSRYQRIPFEEFQKDLSLIWMVERGLEILIQNLLDIGAHLLASEIKNDWEDYVEIIIKLGRHGVIPQEFSEKIKGMAGLRNILVHEYQRVDLAKLYNSFKDGLADFVQFIKYVREYQERSLKK